MAESDNAEERGSRPVGSTGQFGARPTMIKPSANVEPPRHGPRGGAGDSGAAKK